VQPPLASLRRSAKEQARQSISLAPASDLATNRRLAHSGHLQVGSCQQRQFTCGNRHSTNYLGSPITGVRCRYFDSTAMKHKK
jgi:hypothetical protein